LQDAKLHFTLKSPKGTHSLNDAQQIDHAELPSSSTSLDTSIATSVDVLKAAINTLEALKEWIEARDRVVVAMQALDRKSFITSLSAME